MHMCIIKQVFRFFFSSFCQKIDKPKKDNSMSSPFSYGGIMHHTLCYTSSRFLDTKFFYNIPSRKVAIANSAPGNNANPWPLYQGTECYLPHIFFLVMRLSSHHSGDKTYHTPGYEFSFLSGR